MRYARRFQQTITRPVTVAGFGYWSGRDVRLEFRPAPPDTGIVFVRGDLGERWRVPALVGHRVEVPRRTSLSAGGCTVEMVEHVMAGLAGLRIDNCEVWTDQPEMPGCDGSSLPFVAALISAGRVEQDRPRVCLEITHCVRVGDEDCWVEARPDRRPGLFLRYELDYGVDSPIGCQSIELPLTPESFRTELAAARTFLLQHEAQWLLQQGVGGRVTCGDLLVFGEHGPLDNPLRFDDECVRHKTLDLVGDLALAGCDLHGRVTAYRSGHRLNAELVRVLLEQAACQGLSGRVA